MMTSVAEDRNSFLATDVAIKAPCRAATTANITLNGLQTVDGVALAADDRVLVKNQTSGVDNGIYLASTGAWTRTSDFNGNRNAVDGTIVLVRSGTASALSLYKLTCSTSPANIGTTSLTFTLVSVVVGNAGSFTTISASGQISSSVATGTAPLFVASTTKVVNLNVGLLNGTEWTAPGPIGGTTPDTGAFTTISATGAITSGAITSSGTVSDSGGQLARLASPTFTGTALETMGTGSGTASLTAKANAQTATVGNVGGGTDDLMTYSLPANSLSSNGKGVRVTAWGQAANNANAKTLIANFGNITSTLTLTASIVSSWYVTFVAIRSGSNTQSIGFNMSQAANSTAGVQTTFYSAGAVSDTANITIKMTAIGVADNDVVQQGMLVEYIG